MPAPQPASGPKPARPLGGVAAGLALVLLAVLVGAIGQNAARPADFAAAASDAVAVTGNTTTVEVRPEGMRFHPDRIDVPAGDRLVIELTNVDERRHDLVLANGARTASVAPGETARLDAGVIIGAVEGWCSLPGHRAAGIVLTITTAGDTKYRTGPSFWRRCDGRPGSRLRAAGRRPAGGAVQSRPSDHPAGAGRWNSTSRPA